MSKRTTWVGIDDHKMSLTVAVLDPDGRDAAVRTVPNEDRALRRWVRRLVREYGEGSIRMCYEAGPNGFALKRRLEAVGPVAVAVIAPSLTPRRAGARVKTDRRDAAKLARLYRSGELTEIAIPEATDEAARELVRTYHRVATEITRKRHHITKFLIRRGHIYRDGRNWTQRYRRWLRGLRWGHWADEESFVELTTGLEELENRRARMEVAMQRLLEDESRAMVVCVLRCFHGIDTTVALTLVTEIFTVERFGHPRELMSYLGLTPRVSQSGDARYQGAISRAGNRYARWVLGQVAWHYRHRPGVGERLKARRQGAPQWAIAIADRAHHRLHRRFWALVNRGKPSQKASTAVARELVAFIWEAMVEVQVESRARNVA
jgi:transposase